ncbi:MAG: packaged DNA stabilization protein [Stenotrophomonas sp.]
MSLSPLSILGGFNRDDSYAWSIQDVCNWLPTVRDQTGTLTEFKLRTPPGLRPLQSVGVGPIRGIHNCEGRLFVVSGQMLYEVRANGDAISRGNVPGVGRVRMAHNQIKNGNQLAIANGQAGYIYNTVTLAFTRITDEGFPGALDVVFIDAYFFFIEPFGRFWFHSDLADGLNYNTLDRGEAESQPDRLVGLAVNQGEVVLFGERTTEVFQNLGTQTGTFQRIAANEVGCASRDTIQNIDNSVIWLGADGVLYRLGDGYRAVPISTRAIEKTIAQYDWKNAFAFTWEDEGHKVYYITFPDGETFGYDVVVGLWHRRESLGFSRWRLNGCASWGRQWVGTDFQNGQLWVLDWDYHLEGDKEFVSEFTSAKYGDGVNKINVNEVELIMHTGGVPTVPHYSEPTTLLTTPPYPAFTQSRVAVAFSAILGSLRSLFQQGASSDAVEAAFVAVSGSLRDLFQKGYASDSVSASFWALGGALRDAIVSGRATDQLQASFAPRTGALTSPLVPGRAGPNQLNVGFAPTGGSLSV